MEEKEKIEKKEGESSESKPKKKATWKTIVGAALTVLVVVFLIIGVVIVVQAKINKRPPFFFGRAFYFVLTRSMEPTIMAHEVILVEKVDPSTLEKGDIITFIGRGGKIDGETVTHRVYDIDKETGEIITKGDRNGFKDQDPIVNGGGGNGADPVAYDDVVARYIKTSAFLTTAYSIFSSKYGFIFAIVIPLVILLVVQMINFRRACKMDKDGKMPEEKAAEQSAEEAVKEKEEEIKRKAIEAYLASRKDAEEKPSQEEENKQE